MSEIKLSEDQISNAREAFDKFDRRAQDKIPIREIGNAFKAMGVTIKHDWMEKMKESIDQEGTGYIEFEDFIKLYKHRLQTELDEIELRDAFRVLDKHNTGQIAAKDLRWILKSLGDDLTDEEVDDMIADTDTDGSGTVDFEALLQLILY